MGRQDEHFGLDRPGYVDSYPEIEKLDLNLGIQVGNLPIYLGLSEKDIGDLVSKFMLDNYLADVGNTKPVMSC